MIELVSNKIKLIGSNYILLHNCFFSLLKVKDGADLGEKIITSLDILIKYLIRVLKKETKPCIRTMIMTICWL